jgi:hypothetical protein
MAADFASTFPIIEYGIKTADDEQAMALRRMARDARRTADFLHAYCHPHRDDPLRIYEVHARDLPSMRELNLTLERLVGAVSEIAQRASGTFIADHMDTELQARPRS